MNRLFRVLAAGATTLPLLVACGGAPSSGLNLQGEGSIEVALTNAPNDASCLRLTIDTSRNSPYLFDLTPGTSTSSYRINRLPVGRATVDAQAFPVSCSKVASFTGEPLFVSEAPVAVRIDPGDVNSVLLKLVRNGRLNVGIDFDNRVSPYLVGIAPGVVFKDLITVGDSIDGYRMAGIPDGLGAFDNADGRFTVLMNHELGASSGVARAHGGKGAFVSTRTCSPRTTRLRRATCGTALRRQCPTSAGSRYRARPLRR